MPVTAVLVAQTSEPNIIDLTQSEERLSQLSEELLRDTGLARDDFRGEVVFERIWGTSPCLRLPDGGTDPVIYANPEHAWLEIPTRCAYYGPGYERGYLPRVILVAEWLESHIEDCHIWYGPDATHIIEPFGPMERAELRRYYDEVGHTPYHQRCDQARAKRDSKT
jgi:hypothetical protein